MTIQQVRFMVPSAQTLLDAIPSSAALLDRDGRIRLVNRCWTQFCADAGGLADRVVPPADYLAVCDRDTADAIRAVLSRDLDRFEVEYPCHGPDTEQWFRMIVTPMDEGALVLHIDITGEYARVSRWLETTSSPMIELDPAGRAVFVNQAWAELQRAPRRTLLGAGWADHLAEDDRTRLENAIRATTTDRTDRTIDISATDDDCARLWIRFLVSAYCDDYDRLLRVSLVGMDVTAARRLNDQLAASAERERISADIHDIVMQDLLAVGMALQGARTSGNADPALLADMTASLERSVADLRALAASLPSTRLHASDVDAVIRQATLALGFRPDVRVEVTLSELRTDVASDLLTVIKEGLSNVARHAHATRASVSVVHDNGYLVLTVRDNGIGMPDTATRTSGTANIAQRAANFGGEPRWSPAPDGGTVLEWRIPLVPGTQPAARSNAGSRS